MIFFEKQKQHYQIRMTYGWQRRWFVNGYRRHLLLRCVGLIQCGRMLQDAWWMENSILWHQNGHPLGLSYPCMWWNATPVNGTSWAWSARKGPSQSWMTHFYQCLVWKLLPVFTFLRKTSHLPENHASSWQRSLLGLAWLIAWMTESHQVQVFQEPSFGGQAWYSQPGQGLCLPGISWQKSWHAFHRSSSLAKPANYLLSAEGLEGFFTKVHGFHAASKGKPFLEPTWAA